MLPFYMEREEVTEQNDYITANGRRLRCGYTTGSCAAAAAKAATRMLLGGCEVEEVSLVTPSGKMLHLLIEEIRIETGDDGRPRTVHCAVRKDGGDDIDETHGALVFAEVARAEGGEICVDGGKGVGRVTRPGLDQPVGEAAINSVPRSMIREAVLEICAEEGYDGGLSVVISVPEGERIAKKTFNPRLGIEGGISILGTSGIVIPMSEQALVDSIRAEMSMLRAGGGEYLVITPGNYGEAFAAKMRDLDRTYEMKCSNFVGETVDMAAELGVKGLLFIAHIGKFIKVSGGIMNTHSRNADARAELMSAAALRAGADAETARRILAANTTEEALDILAEGPCDIMEKTMRDVAERAAFHLDARARGAVKTGVILFSSARGKLAESARVPELLAAVAEQKNRGEST